MATFPSWAFAVLLVGTSAVALGSGCGDDAPAPATDAAQEGSTSRVDGGPQDSAGPSEADGAPIRDAGIDRSIPDLCVSAGPGPQRIRVLAANITSGNNQGYDEGSGTRLFQTIAADVVLLQEFNYKSGNPTDLREFVTNAFGASFDYVRGPGGQIPNGVITRYPILESGSLTDSQVSNRTFVWARIDIPGPKDLWAFSVHLLTSSATQRNLEAQSLTAQIGSLVVAGDYVAIGGDFNTDNRAEPCLSTFKAVVDTDAPHPADGLGNNNTSANRSKPYDWMVVSPAMRALEIPLKLKSNTFAAGMVLDTRVYTPIAELKPPLLGSESAANNMQHMPVAHDYVVQCN